MDLNNPLSPKGESSGHEEEKNSKQSDSEPLEFNQSLAVTKSPTSKEVPANNLTFIDSLLEYVYNIRLPLIGHLPLQRQVRFLFGFILVFMLFSGFFVWLNNAQQVIASIQIQLAGDALMHSQRIGKAVPNAIQGNLLAFKELEESRFELNRDLTILIKGGDHKGNYLTSGNSAELMALNEAEKIWSTTNKAASTVLKLKEELTDIAQTSEKLTTTSSLLHELTKEIISQQAQIGETPAEISASAQLSMLIQRLARNANEILSSEAVSQETAKDIATLHELVDGFLTGSDKLKLAPTKDAEIRAKLMQLNAKFDEYQQAASMFSGNSRHFMAAKQAGQLIYRDNENLRTHLILVQKNYRDYLNSTSASFYLLFLGIAMTLLAATGMAVVLFQENRHRVKEANIRRMNADIQLMQARKQEHEAKLVNDQNQAAILRLMNELQEIADGDLTVQATVSDDITGAIADSVNYTVEELRGLVGRVVTTTEQVVMAFNQTESVSAVLVRASQEQSDKIKEVTNQLSDLIQAISHATQQHGVSANGVAQNMQQVLIMTERTQESTQQMAQSIRQLSGLVQELESAVLRFRVTV